MSSGIHAVSAIDDAIKEYLLFRGFTHTLRTFESEMKNDRDRGLRVDKIMNQLFTFVGSSDLAALMSFWDYLGRHFFSRLEKCFSASVRKLELCLKRYYVVHAIQNGKYDCVQEFFETLAPELQNQPEWRDWFALPFLKNPESQPAFETYFSRAWLETFTLSLQNFLNTMFHNLPLPTLLSFDDEQIKMRAMAKEIESLRAAAWQGRGASKGSDEGVQPFVVVANVEQTAPALADNNNNNNNSSSNNSERLPPPYAEKSQQQQQQYDTTTDATNNANSNSNTDISTTSNDNTTSNNNAATNTNNNTVSRDPINKNKVHAVGSQMPTTTPPSSAATTTAATPKMMHGEDVEVTTTQATSPTPTSTSLDTSTMVEDGSTVQAFQKEVFILLNQERFMDHQAPILTCNVSCLGTYAASVDTDCVLKVWVTSPTLKTKISTNPGPMMSCLAWDQASDRTIFIGHTDGKLTRMDVETQDMCINPSVSKSHPRIVTLACKGKLLVCSLSTVDTYADVLPEGLLVLLDSKTLEEQARLPMQSKRSIGCSFHFNHNTTLLVVGCVDGMIQIYDVRSKTHIMGWPAHKSKICLAKFSNDETTVFSSSVDSKLMRWNAHHLVMPVTQTMTRAIDVDFIGEYPRALDFAFDNDDEFVLRNCSPSGIDEAGEACIFQLRHTHDTEHYTPVLTLQGHEQAITCLDWCATSNTCFTGCKDGTVNVYTMFKVT